MCTADKNSFVEMADKEALRKEAGGRKCELGFEMRELSRKLRKTLRMS